jgi:hypothetical protein
MPQAELPDYVSQQRIEEQELESKSPPSAKNAKGRRPEIVLARQRCAARGGDTPAAYGTLTAAWTE